MFKFIHMSDPHLLDGDALLYGISPKDRLEACFKHIKINHADAAFVAITGDIAENGSHGAYCKVHDIAKKAELIVFVISGNHDNTSNMSLALPKFNGNLNELESGAWMSSYITHEDRAFIFIDTTSNNSDHGIFDHDKADVLKYNLSSLSAQDIFLFMHHPPFKVGIPFMDMLCLINHEPLYSALAPFKSKIRHIFIGHLHKTINGSWRGIPFSIIRSTVHQVSTGINFHNLDTGYRAIVCDETPEYSVIMVDGDKLVCNAERFIENFSTFLLYE